MEVRVSPTRMQLLSLRRRHKTAVRGHKLLKDKLDELMKQFLGLIRQCRDLREEVDRDLAKAFKAFFTARAVMSREAVEEALMYPVAEVELVAGKSALMGVEVPKLSWKTRQLVGGDAGRTSEEADLEAVSGKSAGAGREPESGAFGETAAAALTVTRYPYGLAGVSSELDTAIGLLAETFPKLLTLAELEKSAELLAAEIEKTRRRVNALEYVLIPELEETVRYITMKLDEAERGNLTRLMKVKDIVRQRNA